MAALLALALLAGACESKASRQGAAIFAQNCARCHGAQGEGQDSRRPFGGIDPALGVLAPALNAEGHCWYHPPGELFDLIKHGTGLAGSPMPAWGERLSDDQIHAVIAHLHSLWPRAIRRQYAQLHEK